MRRRNSTIIQFCLGVILVLLVAWAFPNPKMQAAAEIDRILLTPVTVPVVMHPIPAGYNAQSILQRRPDLVELIMVRAWLLATYDHEGTYPNENSYTLTFAYQRFEGFDDHPNKVVCDSDGDPCSAAAGACQFMPDTFRGIYSAYKKFFLDKDPETGEPIGKFHPLNQDRACLLNYIDKGGPPEFLKAGNWGVNEQGRIWVKPETIDLAFMRLCAQWASFECEPGKGFGDSNGYYDRPDYGNQNAVPIEDTRKIFLKYLEMQEQEVFNLIASISSAAAASTAPPANPGPQAQPEASVAAPITGNPESLFSEEWKKPAVEGETIAGWIITSIRKPNRVDPISGAVKPHKGWDSGAPTGTPVYVFSPGKAICIPDPYPGQKAGSGNQIEFHPDALPNVYFIMKHLSSCEDVNWDGTGNAPITGKTGTTGYSTGPHLHFEMWIDGKDVDYAKGWIYMVYTGQLPPAKVANNAVKFTRTRIKEVV